MNELVDIEYYICQVTKQSPQHVGFYILVSITLHNTALVGQFSSFSRERSFIFLLLQKGNGFSQH